MPTKAEQIRKDVLEALESGCSEEQAARSAGVSVDRVLQILRVIEAPLRREPVPAQEKRTSLPRSSQRSGVKYRVQTSPKLRAKRVEADQTVTAIDKRLTNHNGLPPADHGTESGYSRHKRHKEDACDPCKEAMRLRAARRRQELTESQVTA